MSVQTAPALDSFDDTVQVNGRTARQWEELARSYEAEARGRHQSAADSFDRCDTDGFLSQWASSVTAREYEAKADWARSHGTCLTNVLMTVDGELASTMERTGQWGDYWVLNDAAAAAHGKRFFSESKANTWAKKAKAHARKGFRVAQVQVVAYPPKLEGSNAMNVSPRSQPDWAALKAGQFEVVHADWFAVLSAQWDDA